MAYVPLTSRSHTLIHIHELACVLLQLTAVSIVSIVAEIVKVSDYIFRHL